jgi:type I restriction-modification system DNA methylase subunit
LENWGCPAVRIDPNYVFGRDIEHAIWISNLGKVANKKSERNFLESSFGGSIYERLLEYQLRAEAGAIVVLPNVFARKGSGSYYTPDELVSLIIDRTIGPLIDERLRAFAHEAERLARDKQPTPARLQDLAKLDPASAILDLKVCDPAMGSGHFLVACRWSNLRPGANSE